MTRTIIEQTDLYTLVSISNGAAYEMTHKPTMETKFVQYGDAATAFREEYDAMQTAYADFSSAWHAQNWNACLAYLFNDCV